MEETKLCPYCGKEILAVAVKCQYCKRYLYPAGTTIRCPICCEEIPADSENCPYCHEHIQKESIPDSSSHVVSNPSSGPVNDQKKPSKKVLNRILIVFAFIVILVTAGGIIKYLFKANGGKASSNNATESVDLGLSVNWATCNLGATKPEGTGLYYGWGETRSSDYYAWTSYDLCINSYKTLTKYCTSPKYGSVDYLTELDASEDVAHIELGGSWRIPTKEEFWELINCCTYKWETQNNVLGIRFTSKKNGNSIFLPAVGYMDKENCLQNGVAGYYWSSSLIAEKSFGAYRLWFKDPSMPACDDVNQARYFGMQIRPVQAKTDPMDNKNVNNNHKENFKLTGSIGDHPITMYINIPPEVGEEIGYYYYNKRPNSHFKLIAISVEDDPVDRGLNVVINEFTPKGNNSGAFNGYIKWMSTFLFFDGTFTNSKGQVFDFELSD